MYIYIYIYINIVINYYYRATFLFIQLIIILLRLIVDNWFRFWILIEIGTLGFIYYVYRRRLWSDKRVSSRIINYFFVQSFCSFVYLFSSLTLIFHDIILIPILVAILTKLGFPPFHAWYLYILIKLNWRSNFFLIRLQKFIPLVVINHIINIYHWNVNESIFYTLIFCARWASIIGLTTNSLKLVIGYSSIINICWIVITIFVNEALTCKYYVFYLFVTLNIIELFKWFNLEKFRDFYKLKVWNRTYIYIIILSVLSLAGIPPFFGFIIKWISIEEVWVLPFLPVLTMIFSSVIRLIFYLRFIYSSLIIYFINKKVNFVFINHKYEFPRSLIILNWISLVAISVYIIL